MRAARRRAFVVAAAVLLLAPGAARPAQAQVADASVTRRNVEVAVAGDPEEGRALEDTMRELLARLGLRVVSAASEPERSTVLARVVVLQEKDSAEVVVADGRDGTVVFRRTIVRDASASITREEIAHAVRSAVESTLLSNEKPPPAPAPAPAPPPPAPPPAPVASQAPPADADAHPRSPSSLAVDVTTFAAAGAVGEGSGPVVRFGAGAALAAARSDLRPEVALTFEYALPFEAEGQLLSTRANLVAARARPGVEVYRSSWLAIGVGLGGGVDVFTIAPRSAVLPASSLQPGTTRVDPVVSSAVTAKLALVSSVSLTVAAIADIDPVSHAYVVNDGVDTDRVMSLWRVRPALTLGFGFTALGDGPFAEAPR